MKTYLTMFAALALLVSVSSTASASDEAVLVNCDEISADTADEQVLDLCATGKFGEATEVAAEDLPPDLEASPADGIRTLYRRCYAYRTPSGYYYSGHYGYSYGSQPSYNQGHYVWHYSPSVGYHWGRHGGSYYGGYSGYSYTSYSYSYGYHSSYSSNYGYYGYSNGCGYGRW